MNEQPIPVIAYSEPALRAVTERPWGQASFGLAMFAVFCLMVIFTRNERLILVAGWIQLTAATLGVAAGVLALVRKSPWIALTVTGLTFNGCFLIGDIILALLNGMPIFI